MSGIISKAAESRKEAPVTAVTQQKKPQTLQEYVQRMSSQIKMALPANLNPERFQRIVLTAISSNPKLQECAPTSFLGAMMTAAQLGVEPNTPLGQGYLIPRNGRNGMECTFQLGYKGMIDLAYRSGNISTIGAYVVHQNDEFHVQFGLNPDITHVPCMADRGDPIAFYAYYKTKDGGFGFEVMSVDEARAHSRKYSDSVKRGWSSPWDTNFEEMAKKTVLKKVLKYAPLSTDTASRIDLDASVRNVNPDDQFKSFAEEPIVYTNIDAETGEVLTDEEAGK